MKLIIKRNEIRSYLHLHNMFLKYCDFTRFDTPVGCFIGQQEGGDWGQIFIHKKMIRYTSSPVEYRMGVHQFLEQLNTA